MTAPGRLSLYVARRFSTAVALMIATVTVILLLAEYVEAVRRFSDEAEFTPMLGIRLGLLRLPIILDGILPFAFLFGALLSLLSLSARLELVIARASGVSVWGFLRPTFVVALLFGAFATAVFNPLAVESKQASKRAEAALSGSEVRRDGGFWFRQDSPAGPSIVYAASVSEDGVELIGVTAIVFSPEGEFREKVTGPRAVFRTDRWEFETAELISPFLAPRQVADYELPTALRGAELRRSVAQPSVASVWTLPEFIDSAQRTGIESDRLRLEFHTLLSRPLFLVAMTTVAATVSLQFSRYGGAWRLILTGAALGFLLYVLTRILSDLGEHGIIDPVLAAWLPPILALTFAGTALLYQEDG